MDLDVCALLPPFLFILLVIKFAQSYFSDAIKNLPPGPPGLPIVGYLPFVGYPPHVKFQKLAAKYGKICSFYLGQNLVVLLNDFEVIKEAFVKQGDVFGGRPESFPFKTFPFDEGIVTAEGQIHRDYKTFIQTTLKEAGAVKASLDLIVKDNVEDFVKFLKRQGTDPYDVLDALGLSVAQTFCFLLMGKRFDSKDPWFQNLLDLHYRQQRHYVNGPRIYLQWARKMPFLSSWMGEKEMRQITSNIYKLVDEVITENEKDYVEGSTANFIHAWMNEDRRRRRKNPDDKLFDRQHLIFNINITFGAASETTTTTILWGFMFLLLHPDVADKIHEEIENVVGFERGPSLADALHMPYTQATILEIHRFATIGPLGVQHRNKQDATLCGYHIPKDTYIISNQLAVHMNPKIFPEPLKFQPERFLDEKGNFKRREEMLSFSIGKRACPGEPLAQAEIFMYLTHVLQNFQIKHPDGQELPFERSGSLSAEPKPFKIQFIPRKYEHYHN